MVLKLDNITAEDQKNQESGIDKAKLDALLLPIYRTTIPDHLKTKLYRYFEYLGDAAQWNKKHLMFMMLIGKKTVEALEQEMTKHGLQLGMKINPATQEAFEKKKRYLTHQYPVGEKTELSEEDEQKLELLTIPLEEKLSPLTASSIKRMMIRMGGRFDDKILFGDIVEYTSNELLQRHKLTPEAVAEIEYAVQQIGLELSMYMKPDLKIAFIAAKQRGYVIKAADL